MLIDSVNYAEIENKIYKEIVNLIHEKTGLSVEIKNEHKLNADLEISSLEFARLISVLEAKLNIDPFLEMVSITSIRTVGDLVSAYQEAFE